MTFQLFTIKRDFLAPNLNVNLCLPFAKYLQTAPLPQLLFSDIDLFHLQKKRGAEQHAGLTKQGYCVRKVKNKNTPFKRLYICCFLRRGHWTDLTSYHANKICKHAILQLASTNCVWHLMKYAYQKYIMLGSISLQTNTHNSTKLLKLL